MGTLTSAIDGLGEKERLVITLYYYEELKYSEIAQVMGIGQSRYARYIPGNPKAESQPGRLYERIKLCFQDFIQPLPAC